MLVCSYLIPETCGESTVLVPQLRRMAPDARIVLLDLCADAPTIPGAELVVPSDLHPGDEPHRLAMFARSSAELVDVLTPWALHWALEQDEDVLWVDPRSLLFEAPTSLLEAARRDGFAVIASLPEELAEDGCDPAPRVARDHGLLERSIIAASRSGLDVVAWWRDRSRVDELARRAASHEDHPGFVRSTSPRRFGWLDAIPTVFDVHVDRTGEWARSAWNLTPDPIAEQGSALAQDGRPIRSLSLESLDVDVPWLFAPALGDSPRIYFSEQRALWRACTSWMDEVRAARSAAAPLEPAFQTLGDGTIVDERMRRVFERTARFGDPYEADPFDPEHAQSFRAWLDEPESEQRLSRYLACIWFERPDLQAMYPDALNTQGLEFENWLISTGGVEEQVPEWLMPEDRVASRGPAPSRDDLRRGVLVSGFFGSVMGLGEAARLVVDAVRDTGLDHATYTYAPTLAQQADEFQERGDHHVRYDTHVTCVNIDSFPRFVDEAEHFFLEDRKTIGLWFWETPEIPEPMRRSFNYVSEIWVASRFVGDIMRAYTDAAIEIYPQPVPVPQRGTATRAELGLPPEFTFLFAFDFNSVTERKNPLGLIEAFTRAFEPGEGPQLMLKTINGSKHRSEFERLKLAVAERADLHLVDEYFSSAKRDAWIAECDCYVSLHRSEGFGLPMAEAMAVGRPVIATRYGGNLEFMDDANSLLVDATTTTVPDGCHPYPVGATWADPDVDQAAAHMRAVYDDADLRERIGEAARQHITTRHTTDAMATWITRRLRRRLAAPARAVDRATFGRARGKLGDLLARGDRSRG